MDLPNSVFYMVISLLESLKELINFSLGWCDYMAVK